MEDELKLVPLNPTEKQCGGLSRHLGRYMQMHDRYCPKTLKKYFDRFIGEPPEWLSKEVSNWILTMHSLLLTYQFLSIRL